MKDNLNISNIQELCIYAHAFLDASGFKPKYKYPETQLDCIINGMSFAIYGDDTPTFGFGCIFEPNEELTDEEMDNISNLFKNEDIPFDYLHFTEDTVCVESEIPIADFSEELMGWIVDSLSSDTGVLSLLKSKSHIWRG